MWDLGMCKLSYHTGRRPESLKCSYLELDWMSMAMEAPDLAVSPGFRESTCGLSIPQSIWKPLPVLPASFPGPWQSLGLFENHQRHGAPRKEKGYLGNWKRVVWDSCWEITEAVRDLSVHLPLWCSNCVCCGTQVDTVI